MYGTGVNSILFRTDGNGNIWIDVTPKSGKSATLLFGSNSITKSVDGANQWTNT